MSSNDSTIGFLPWDGGENPAPGCKVVARLRGKGVECNVAFADGLRWSHTGDGGDIVSYKIVDGTVASPCAAFQIGGLNLPPIDASMISAAMINGEKQPDWASCPGGAVIGFDLATGPDRTVMSIEIPPGYEKLAAVLIQAFDQAAGGKGKERHARAGVAFQDQPMALINKQIGSVDGFIYQAHKKSLEAIRLPDGRAQAELLGAMNYLAGAVIALDTWANKSSSKD